MSEKIRNIAIIAHVDHGKTTLVDQLLKQSQTLDARAELAERAMDSNDLERERGITILAKNTAIQWGDFRINIVDTPGHADFGGEVERILSMVDSVLLLVDAVEGPMPQTRFVTQKAFAWGLKPIVVVNKIDRDGARPDWVVDQVFDLFVNLEANDDQLDFPVIYASAIQGFARKELADNSNDMTPLFETIVKKVSPPDVDVGAPLQLQISSMSYSSFVGVIGVGRIKRGTIQKGMMVTVVDKAGGVRKAKVTELYGFMGLEQRPIEQANAGDIIALAGIDPLHISDTVCDPAAPEALPALTVDEPTLMMTFQVNDSPFAGKEGKYITSRQIKARLEKELLHNVALRVEPTEDPDKFKVAGRGELHLSILIENMRREGYELSVSRPEVVYKEVEGVLCEPFEMLLLDIEEQHQGAFMQQLNEAGAEMQDMVPDGKGRIQLCFIAPTRALIGFHSQFMMTTSGTGIMHHVFDHYGPVRSQNLVTRRRGVLITKEPGVATAYSLYNLQPRGELFIGPQTAQYEGMIIGIHARSNDLVVNANKGKQLTNIRAAGSDENIILTPPIKLTLEYALGFIDDDELVEITPASIRLRKKKLKEHERKRSKK